MRPFVIFDRDGTLIAERDYLSDPAGVELLPGAAAAVMRCSEAGLGVVVISNQSGVGRGYFTLDAVERVNLRMLELLEAAGARVEGVYVCPHAPEDGCDCRKPKTGLVARAVRELNLNPSQSFVVGDKEVDIELAHNIGARGVLVKTGYGEEAALASPQGADYIADGVREAAEWIASHRQGVNKQQTKTLAGTPEGDIQP